MRPVNVAWLGPAPRADHGVPHVAMQILVELGRQGVSIDGYTVARVDELPRELLADPELRWVLAQSRWQWDRWYSRTAPSAFLTRQAARTAGQLRLGSALRRRNARRRYAAVYQFSAIESLGLRRHRQELPPLVLHPQVHAAGELRWHRREATFATAAESRPRRVAVTGMLTARARVQARDARAARLVIAPSRAFADDLMSDYSVARERLRVVPNPVDLHRFRPPAPEAMSERATVVFVAQIAVRKGVELVVELTHRLNDLADELRLVIAGGPRPWSDYSRLLQGANARVADVVGWLQPDEVAALYRTADLMLQPSRYEPFGLSAAEALASGVPVVASDVVGAAEWVSRDVCPTFPSGDIDALESLVRAEVVRVRGDRAAARAAARAEAERAFAPARVAAQVAAVLEECV